MKNTRAALHEFKSGGAVASQQGVSKGNDWEFGQLLPVILLLLPLCSVAQNYFGAHDLSLMLFGLLRFIF